MLVSFINSNSVPATKAGSLMNKSSLVKFHAAAGYDEILPRRLKSIQELRNAADTTVSFGIIQLLRCADVIGIYKEKFILSNNAIKYSGLAMPEKAKLLYDAYIKSNNSIISECERITGATLKFYKNSYSLTEPRRAIISFLKECPVNEWISLSQLSSELYREDSSIFAVVGDVRVRDYDDSSATY